MILVDTWLFSNKNGFWSVRAPSWRCNMYQEENKNLLRNMLRQQLKTRLQSSRKTACKQALRSQRLCQFLWEAPKPRECKPAIEVFHQRHTTRTQIMSWFLTSHFHLIVYTSFLTNRKSLDGKKMRFVASLLHSRGTLSKPLTWNESWWITDSWCGKNNVTWGEKRKNRFCAALGWFMLNA